MQKKLSLITSLGLLAIIMSLALTPAISLAKERGDDRGRNDDKEERREEKRERKEEKKERKEEKREERKEIKWASRDSRYCFKAFGHLIAPGWVKNFGPSSTSTINCWLPFGIGKKFGNSTTTLDIIPPVIRQVAVTSSTSTISVSWRTNEPSTSRLWYGTTTPIASTTANLVENNTLKLNHLLTISGLATGTPYYLVIESLDGSGNSQKSAQFIASTTATSTP